mmetsp:Transcript_27812/g.70071  ORF Transcript_27812/g.70071 Transcript_27812/m.70071 type:complete len:238 (-) Transcript_27812:1220-1933(-)
MSISTSPNSLPPLPPLSSTDTRMMETPGSTLKVIGLLKTGFRLFPTLSVCCLLCPTCTLTMASRVPVSSLPLSCLAATTVTSSVPSPLEALSLIALMSLRGLSTVISGITWAHSASFTAPAARSDARRPTRGYQEKEGSLGISERRTETTPSTWSLDSMAMAEAFSYTVTSATWQPVATSRRKGWFQQGQVLAWGSVMPLLSPTLTSAYVCGWLAGSLPISPVHPTTPTDTAPTPIF